MELLELPELLELNVIIQCFAHDPCFFLGTSPCARDKGGSVLPTPFGATMELSVILKYVVLEFFFLAEPKKIFFLSLSEKFFFVAILHTTPARNFSRP